MTKHQDTVLLGYELGTGEPVSVPLRHLAVTGQTQASGKTTTLEALATRSGKTVLTFVTKRGEGAFADAHRVQPYFRDRADWKFVSSIIDATLQEKNKFLRPWIMRICRTTKTLAEVQRAVREALKTAKGINEGVYTQLDEYLEMIVPVIGQARLAPSLTLRMGRVNVMDLSAFDTTMQMLFVQSALDFVNAHCSNTIVVIPEAWEFIPEGKGSPVKESAVTLVRKGGGIGNHIWVDSQDMAGVDKVILRGCTVWILGVQREANEIKRNLANIPAGIKRPKPSDIALLERGQFFACFGSTVVKVYVLPSWMLPDTAAAIACGDRSVMDFIHVEPRFSVPPEAIAQGRSVPNSVRATFVDSIPYEAITPPKESDVKEVEANALRAENADLKSQIEELRSGRATYTERREVGEIAIERKVTAAESPRLNVDDMDSVIMELHRRAPALLKLLVSVPEIEVKKVRQTVTADHAKQPGFLAAMITEGFFDAAQPGASVAAELKRRGRAVHNTNVYRDLNRLAEQGFLTVEGGGYQAVPGMKVRIIEA